jgi:hypothetical protein
MEFKKNYKWSGKLGDRIVETASIADGAVTTAKLADNSVTPAKIPNRTRTMPMMVAPVAPATLNDYFGAVVVLPDLAGAAVTASAVIPQDIANTTLKLCFRMTVDTNSNVVTFDVYVATAAPAGTLSWNILNNASHSFSPSGLNRADFLFITVNHSSIVAGNYIGLYMRRNPADLNTGMAHVGPVWIEYTADS